MTDAPQQGIRVPLTVAVVSAGLSDPSSTRLLADRLGQSTVHSLREAGADAVLDVVELRPLAHDIADHLVTRITSPALAAAYRTVTSADAIIAVTPVFAMSYSGLFKSFFDGVEERQLASIPTLLGATGGSVRHSMVLDTVMRPLFAYLGGLVAPTGVFAATEDWGGNVGLDSRIDRAGAQFASLMLGSPRQRRADPFDPEDDSFTDFGTLLGGA